MKRLVILLCAMLMLTGCTGAPAPVEQEDVPEQEVVTLHAITLGNMPEGGLDSLYAQLDALTVPELGCKLRFTYIPWGDERNQINIAISSGEYDIIPQGNFSDYQLMAARNAFLDIKPYLAMVPALAEHYKISGEDVLANAEIDGKLFGIPQHGAPGVEADEGFFYREDLRKAWGLEPITDLATMEAYLYRAKEDGAFRDKPLITDNRIWTCLWMMLTRDAYFEVTSFTDTPYVVCPIDMPYQAVSRVETPEFRQALAYLAKWYRDGILDKRLLTLSANEGSSGRAMMLAGDKPCETNSPIWSINRDWIPVLTEAHPEWEYGFFTYNAGGRITQYKETSSSGSLLSISSRTKHPEIAVRLLEKLHTDQRYYTLLLYGVEGEHFYRNEQGVHNEGIPSGKRFAGWSAAADTYLDWPVIHNVDSQWTRDVYLPLLEEGNLLVEQAVFHPLNQFTFNINPVGSEATALAAAWNTYMLPLLCGMSEDIDAELDEAIRMLKEAGLDAYLAEVQNQLTQFKQESEK